MSKFTHREIGGLYELTEAAHAFVIAFSLVVLGSPWHTVLDMDFLFLHLHRLLLVPVTFIIYRIILKNETISFITKGIADRSDKKIKMYQCFQDS